MIDKKLAIAILSCDKYSDLWEPFFHCFFEAWPDCPYNIYLETNSLTFNDDRVISIPVGQDETWSKSLKQFLEKIPESHTLIFLEDIFLTKTIKTSKIHHLFEKTLELDATYFRLRPVPLPDKIVQSGIGELAPNAMWRTAVAFSIWNNERFKDLIVDEENAWDFDIGSYTRSSHDPRFFGTTKVVFPFIHGVQKGKWFPWSYLRMKIKKAPISKARPIMNRIEATRSAIDFCITFTFQVIPGRYQPFIQTKIKSLWHRVRPKREVHG